MRALVYDGQSLYQSEYGFAPVAAFADYTQVRFSLQECADALPHRDIGPATVGQALADCPLARATNWRAEGFGPVPLNQLPQDFCPGTVVWLWRQTTP